MESKECSRCNQVKPLSDFYKDKRYKNNVISWCIKCKKDYYRSKNNPKLSREGLVYCLECEGFYKFGITRSNMKKRMKAMRTGNPFPINIIWTATSDDAGKYERMIHDKIKDSHVRGEWYDIPKVLAKELRGVVTHDE